MRATARTLSLSVCYWAQGKSEREGRGVLRKCCAFKANLTRLATTASWHADAFDVIGGRGVFRRCFTRAQRMRCSRHALQTEVHCAHA